MLILPFSPSFSHLRTFSLILAFSNSPLFLFILSPTLIRSSTNRCELAPPKGGVGLASLFNRSVALFLFNLESPWSPMSLFFSSAPRYYFTSTILRVSSARLPSKHPFDRDRTQKDASRASRINECSIADTRSNRILNHFAFRITRHRGRYASN